MNSKINSKNNTLKKKSTIGWIPVKHNIEYKNYPQSDLYKSKHYIKNTRVYQQISNDCISMAIKACLECMGCKDIYSPHLYLFDTTDVFSTLLRAKIEGVMYQDDLIYNMNALRKPINKSTVHLIKDIARVTSWEQLCHAISNNKPVVGGSSIGINLLPSIDGFHKENKNWKQTLVFTGYSENDYALAISVLGNVHGRLRDFDTNDVFPPGTVRIEKHIVEKILQDDFWVVGLTDNEFDEK